MKRCTRCKQEKPTDEFHRKGDGWQGWCKQCAIAARVDYYRRHSRSEAERNKARQRKLHAWACSLKDSPCMDCKQRYHPCQMQWDHRPGAGKTQDISQMVTSSRSRKAILEEIAKCDLVCANCHALRTFTRRN